MPHLLFVSEGHVLLQDPQKLGLVFRLAQNLPLLVVHAVGSAAEHCTVQFPASSNQDACWCWLAGLYPARNRDQRHPFASSTNPLQRLHSSAVRAMGERCSECLRLLHGPALRTSA